MDAATLLQLFAIALGASALGGMLGMASGIFIVPILTVFAHIELHNAIGASIVSVIACSCAGASSSLKSGLTNVRLAIVLETATTLGALTGTLLVGVLPIAFLYVLFAAVLLISAQQMLARRREAAVVLTAGETEPWSAAMDLDSSYPDELSGRAVPYRVYRLKLGMLLMYGAGLISALLGIGSGVLKIPAMDTALRLPIKVSSATSNFMIGVTAAASAWSYFRHGDIITAIAAPVALGSVLGAVLGARILLLVSSERLRILFALVLVALAGQMLFSAWNVRVTGPAQ